MYNHHPSHRTRVSDASSFDEICELCYVTDRSPHAAEPCNGGRLQPTLVKPYPCCERVRRVERVPGDATTLIEGFCPLHGETVVVREPVTEQAPPVPATGDVWLLVLEDMRQRREHGIEKYGVPVQVGNGRDALVDAYQECLDLCVYLRQEIETRRLKATPG